MGELEVLGRGLAPREPRFSAMGAFERSPIASMMLPGIVGYRLGDEEPGLMIRVQAMPPSRARDTPRVWLEVKDARAAANALRGKGAALLSEPMEILTGWKEPPKGRTST